jgi:S1/P1 Nuclease
MRRSPCSTFTAIVLVMLVAAPPSAWSWGNPGHEAVAYVAWQQLSQPVKDRVFALLQQVPSRTTPAGDKTIPGFKEWSQDLPDGLSTDQQHMYIFMRAATWPDSIKHVGLHDSDTPPGNSAEARSNLGFTDPDSHGYWHFVDTPFGTAATRTSTPPPVPKSCWMRKKGQAPVPPTPVQSIPKVPVPDAATEITLLSGFLASNESSSLKAYDMIWLEHLVGDIHQPLHASVRFVNGISDVGGNCVAISVPADLRQHFAGSGPSSRPPTELHAFWDDLPGVGTQMETQTAVDYAATLAQADADQASISDPNAWTKESFDMAVKDVYAAPIGPALGSPTAYGITDNYYAAAAEDAKIRIALAGARLANLLTKTLQ